MPTVEYGYDIHAQIPKIKLEDTHLVHLELKLSDSIDFQREHILLKVNRQYDDDDYDRWASFIRSQYFDINIGQQ